MLTGKEERERDRLAKPGVGLTLVVSTWKGDTGGLPGIKAILGSTVTLVSKYKENKKEEGREGRKRKRS